jgi:DNA-binding MurR/RpiR family transcriptional regulator
VLTALLRHADEVPYLSARDLARRAGVSQPSVTRLAHVLGFDGYAAMREELRAIAPSPYDRAGHAGGDRWGTAVDLEADNLRRLRDGLLPESVWADMGAALAGSRPLVVVGLRASRYLAAYLTYLARKVHPHVVEVSAGGVDALDSVRAAHDLGADTAVVICMPRYPRATVDLVSQLASLGYRVVLVADDLMPPTPGRRPTWCLRVPVGSGLTFDGHPAAAVVLSLLVEALCNADPVATESRLERLDRTAEEVGTYWEP